MSQKGTEVKTQQKSEEVIEERQIEKEMRLSNHGKGIIVWGSMVFIAVALCFVFCLFFYGKAKETGERFGNTIGNAVGMAVGSCEGITKRVPEGIEDGKEQGLSAEDTKVDISTQVKSMGKLEVLVASVALTDFQEIGDDYKALYVCKADAIFTVNLEKAEITEDDKGVKIVFKYNVPYKVDTARERDCLKC